MVWAGAVEYTVKIKFEIATLGRSKWYEYLVRFAFGGAVTALAGIVAKRWGPGIGGLFLAFPSIFPATATLLQKREKQKEQRAGNAGILRAREIAGVDAAGAAMGSLGLLVFAVVVWRSIPNHSVTLVLCAATLGWSAVALSAWGVHETIWRKFRSKWPSVERDSALAHFPRESSVHRKVK
jgi:hypothetical protein